MTELIQPACPFCGSVALIYNGHLKTNIRANARSSVTIRLEENKIKEKVLDHEPIDS